MSANTLSARLHALEAEIPDSYWAKRGLEEMFYLLELFRCSDQANDELPEYTELLERGVEILEADSQRFTAITQQTVMCLEEVLRPLSERAKKLRVMCCGNAHIDMNWMWGYQETVSVTVDTIRTVLALLKEYPQMTYTQSQASVYQILEKYAPDTIPQIRSFVREGRWEASVSSWVENDKNMSSLEAMARHLLYAKEYISQLLEIPIQELELDFEPDTFGHPSHLPEILQAGGVRYYYHCRGHEGPYFFRWQAPSGAQVLAFREPNWYNLSIDYGMYRNVPKLCSEYKIDTMLSVFGVGDHGGGPTRRDLDRLCDIQNWPLFPTIEFGTVQSFFHRIESAADGFPVIGQELNYVFTGCYTSQGRIKRANRLAEDKLCQMEALEVMARSWMSEYPSSLEKKRAWEHVLFNQFHDILPGSGTVETKEYAMGLFQSAMACAQTESVRAIRALGMDAAAKECSLPLAGSGSLTADANDYGISQAGVQGGECSFLLVNTLPYRREELVSLTIWDWQREPERIRIVDLEGNILPSQLEETGTLYWGHTYVKLLVKAELPAMGYRICGVEYEQPKQVIVPMNQDIRRDAFGNGPLILENSKICAVFSRETMECLTLVDKESGQSMLKSQKAACTFWMDTEDPVYGMTAWRVGPRINSRNLNQTENVRVSHVFQDPKSLRQKITYRLTFSRSRIEVSISLDQDSPRLDFQVKVDWLELGETAGVPMLRFSVPYAYEAEVFRYLTAGGIVERSAKEHDVPSRGLACAVNDRANASLVLLCDCKYGFSGDRQQLGVSILRSPFDPDPYPDQGTHYLKLGLAVSNSGADSLELLAERMSHPVLTGACPLQKGEMPKYAERSLMEVSGAICHAVKCTENGEGFLLRLVNPGKQKREAQIVWQNPVKEAYLTDILERDCRPVSRKGNTVRWEMEPFALYSLVIVAEKTCEIQDGGVKA